MDQPTVLRTARMGGFVKEDVLAYVDELNSKIYALEEERDDLKAKASSGGGVNADAVKQYEDELGRLRGELGTAKNQLRAAQDELKNRPVIESDGTGAGSSEELEAAKQQIAALTAELTDAKANLDAAQAELTLYREDNDSMTAKLDAAKADVERLTAENASLRSDLSEAAASALTSSGDGAQTEAQVLSLQAQLRDANDEIESLKAELSAKDSMIDEQSGLSNETDLKKIAEYEAMLSEQSSTMAEKDREIERLQQQVNDLKETSGEPTFDMSALFMEAQLTAKKVAMEARSVADKLTRDAKEQAESIVSEANAKAEQTVQDAVNQAKQSIATANAQADTTIANANAEAERKLNEADAKATKTVTDAEESVRTSLAEAERRTKTTTDTARTIRALLRSEIDGVSKKFNEISLILENLSDQAGSRLTEAKSVIGEARTTVSGDEELPSFESFDEVASKSFSKVTSNDDAPEQPSRGAKKNASFEFSFDDLAKNAGESGDGWT